MPIVIFNFFRFLLILAISLHVSSPTVLFLNSILNNEIPIENL